jgi:hypothetical protein
MVTAISLTKESGKMINPMDKEHLSPQMEKLFTRDYGKMANKRGIHK